MFGETVFFHLTHFFYQEIKVTIKERSSTQLRSSDDLCMYKTVVITEVTYSTINIVFCLKLQKDFNITQQFLFRLRGILLLVM